MTPLLGIDDMATPNEAVLTGDELEVLRQQRREYPDLIGVAHFDAVLATLDACREELEVARQAGVSETPAARRADT